MLYDLEFVCIGNNGRSPIAAAIAKKFLFETGISDKVRITSSGTLVDVMKKSPDSKKGYFLGGTGKIHNWKISKQIIKSSSIPIIVAGGLNIDNVQEAISFLHPYGIDVESALRNKKGYRDLIKVKKFINKIKSL